MADKGSPFSIRLTDEEKAFCVAWAGSVSEFVRRSIAMVQESGAEPNPLQEHKAETRTQSAADVAAHIPGVRVLTESDRPQVPVVYESPRQGRPVRRVLGSFDPDAGPDPDAL